MHIFDFTSKVVVHAPPFYSHYCMTGTNLCMSQQPAKRSMEPESRRLGTVRPKAHNPSTAPKKKNTRKTKSVGVQVTGTDVPDNYFLKYEGELAQDFISSPSPIHKAKPTIAELEQLLKLSFPSYIREIHTNSTY